MGGRHCAQSIPGQSSGYALSWCPASAAQRMSSRVLATCELITSALLDIQSGLYRIACESAVLVKGKRVLELGCGTGIVGITAACMGAMAVLTDTAAVVQHAQQNVERNASLIKAKEGSAQCATLVWEMSCSSSVLHKPYDVVIGADLIYAAKDIGPLAETLATLQQHSSDVIIYLAHKERNLGISQELIAQLSSKGIVMQAIFRSGAVTVYMTS